MADPQTNTSSETPGEGRRSARPPGDDQSRMAQGEERAFASSGAAAERVGEGVKAASDLSRSAAETTRSVGEKTREAAREMATNWRGALEPFVGLQMDMNRWFDDLWRQAGLGGGLPFRTARPFSFPAVAPLLGLPAIDVKETAKSYILCAELPGLTRDDVDLQINGDVLLIAGQKREAKDEGTAAYRVSERRFGSFERRLPIPPDVEREGIDAAFRDGVLTVTLPRKSDAQPRGAKIDIKG